MKSLDGDDKPVTGIKDKQIIFSKRDCVQFVSYESVGYNPCKLMAEVLKEIPAQITGYFYTKKIYPGGRDEKNLDRFKDNKDTYFPRVLDKIKKQAEASCDPEKVSKLLEKEGCPDFRVEWIKHNCSKVSDEPGISINKLLAANK